MKSMKRMIKAALVVAILGGTSFCSSAYAAVSVSNIVCRQHYPWNGLVDIDYEVFSDDPSATFWVYPKGEDKRLGKNVKMLTLTGDGATNAVTVGKHRMVWDAKADMPKFYTSDLRVTLQVIANATRYIVVDVSAGTNAVFYPTRYSYDPPDLSNDTCRTDEIWLRLVLPGTFIMGSPTNEYRHVANEAQHQVTLTKPYYIGVFEITQGQWRNVMGENPSVYGGDCRPVENVSYLMIRGASKGRDWPSSRDVDGDSFMGIIRAKTSLMWDLPTEAQWEYACRAGTVTALNTGKEASDMNMAEAGRFYGNKNANVRGYSDTHAPVGCFLPNNWGLYDMHGNVFEWCLDCYNDYVELSPVIDPVGWSSGDHIIRGGGWDSTVDLCRSARRLVANDTSVHYGVQFNLGFRAVVLPFD